MTLSEQGNIDKANEKIKNLRNTISEKDDQYIMLIVMSAEINIKAENYEEAIVDNEELIKLFPSGEIVSLIDIARFKKFMGDFDGAFVAHKRIFELDPKDSVTYNNMASTYIFAGKYREAINLLNSNPNAKRLPTEEYLYAIAYYHINAFDSAKYYIDKFLQNDHPKNDFEVYKYAAQIYASLLENKKSCEYITKANELIITSRWEEEIRNKTKKIQDYYMNRLLLKSMAETKALKTILCQ